MGTEALLQAEVLLEAAEAIEAAVHLVAAEAFAAREVHLDLLLAEAVEVAAAGEETKSFNLL